MYAEGDQEDLQRIKNAAVLAHSLGIEVAAGHGLTHLNLAKLVDEVPETSSDIKIDDNTADTAVVEDSFEIVEAPI